uniref:Thioredoxin-dependent peroxide reductase, mitochondrial n=1 Tax=Xenopus tropicalis TaxID=8364 RepID=A0A803JAH4_XENTR
MFGGLRPALLFNRERGVAPVRGSANQGCDSLSLSHKQHGGLRKVTGIVGASQRPSRWLSCAEKCGSRNTFPLCHSQTPVQHHTFVCPTEIVAFSNKANEFHDVNCEVVAVSVDSHFCHLAWTNTPRKSGGLGQMNIPLLSDLNKQISRDYGVLLETPGIALRGLFIIDPNGIIKHMSVNDLPVGRSVEETLRLVKAFQFVETHGEVCPANWTPDSPTQLSGCRALVYSSNQAVVRMTDWKMTREGPER